MYRDYGPHLVLCVRSTAAVAQWLERPSRKQEVVGSIPGRDRSKSLKMLAVAFPLGAQDYGNSTTTGLQSQDNGLVKYWLKIVQETWICELSPLNN